MNLIPLCLRYVQWMGMKRWEKLTGGPRNPFPPGSPLGPGGPCWTEKKALHHWRSHSCQSPANSLAVSIFLIPQRSPHPDNWFANAHLSFCSTFPWDTLLSLSYVASIYPHWLRAALRHPSRTKAAPEEATSSNNKAALPWINISGQLPWG